MKKVNFLVFVFGILMCVGFTSCSNDDDDNKGNGSVSSCTSVVDGHNSAYKYAYLFIGDEPFNGKYEYSIYFSSFDVLYYLSHPDKISDNIMGSMFMLDFDSSTAFNGNNLPIGEYAPDYYGCEIEFDIPISYFVGENMDNDYPGSIWYTTSSNNTSALIVSTASDGMYKMEISGMKLLASEPGEGHTGPNSRETSGTFSFVGIPKAVSEAELDNYTRGVAMSGSTKSHKRLVMKLESN